MLNTILCGTQYGNPIHQCAAWFRHDGRVRMLFDGDVFVHYGFINLIGADDEPAELMATRAGQRNGLMGAAVPGQLSLITGLHTGDVPLAVGWHDTEPTVGDEWEEVVELSFQPPQADLVLQAFQDSYEIRLPAVRTLRVRYCATGMDAGHNADTTLEGEPAPDRYRLDLWPAEPGPEAIVRQTSEIAAYWHQEARKRHPGVAVG
jgi:hypothetical protein